MLYWYMLHMESTIIYRYNYFMSLTFPRCEGSYVTKQTYIRGTNKRITLYLYLRIIQHTTLQLELNRIMVTDILSLVIASIKYKCYIYCKHPKYTPKNARLDKCCTKIVSCGAGLED